MSLVFNSTMNNETGLFVCSFIHLSFFFFFNITLVPGLNDRVSVLAELTSCLGRHAKEYVTEKYTVHV